MANMIIKPAAGGNLLIQDRAGGAVLSTSTSGATIANATLSAPTIADLSNVSGTLASTVVGSNRPYFSATLGSGNQTIATTTHTKINFSDELLDSNSNYDTSNKRFTPNVAGWYWFGCYAIIADLSSSAYYYIRLYKNGSSVARAMDGGHASDWHGPALSTVQQANGSSDYFEAYCFHVHGGDRILYTTGLGSPATEGSGFFGWRIN